LQFYIPPGFAHGFAVLSETALFQYKCTDLYSPSDEATLLWNDPEVGIKWPIAEPLLSDKDRRGLPLKALPPEKLF
jgi:dTDP-4-dehydrorhamnose 3,5-epimerase